MKILMLTSLIAVALCAGCEFPSEEPDVDARLGERLREETLFEPVLVDSNGAINITK